MAEFFESAFWIGFLWPLIVMLAQSVLLLVVLLVAIAYILLADRKIWAAVQIRRGPNVVGPWGLFQSFADHHDQRPQEAGPDVACEEISHQIMLIPQPSAFARMPGGSIPP